MRIQLILVKVFDISQAKHSMEVMKLTLFDFSRRVTEGCRSDWLQILEYRLVTNLSIVLHT